jgi:hypothetical protein
MAGYDNGGREDANHRLLRRRDTGSAEPQRSPKKMKKEFQILKDRPRLSFRITRDSVCAGDDCDAPHERVIELPSFLDPDALARHAAHYLPAVAGFGHSWICKLNGKRIAALTHDGIRGLTREVVFEEANSIHWVYNSATY